ncbi:DUF3016 domain-containing protein [Pseudidiomarina gelatinasegens]|uniref:DUF3016 domain-containing protein n=1 Tax=Pseudidiomarina gelatinasegens TaxID=2487740 RepID=A0A443YXV2_9GAMM|nr:DUF3016 domain-containing protein [Pseudidiomarina gelatinasegens]RWU08814.1 DUF3016 domain-containing protein [Pseudidiomarina gelatinasegens]|tara:strand:+ start:1715 stop:2227 length:513 start_codon:yes stop_codon:yes gene_type:complete
MKTLLASVTVVAAMLIAPVHAAKVEVKWDEVKSFSDFEAVNELQSRFEERTKAKFEEYVAELGAKLPESNTLQVTFKDVDLAGRVDATFGATTSGFQRVLDDVSYPELVISYRYTDAQGAELSSADKVELKSLAPPRNMRNIQGSSHDSLYFEKELLMEWFNDTFPSAKR